MKELKMKNFDMILVENSAWSSGSIISKTCKTIEDQGEKNKNFKTFRLS